ncbi:PilZ domain-containing protein [Xanthomonadaceae bacterium JHOS43]|nr:PilZ domain-containing protein [Xanthomonadaceae bacterium JHOS43]MCX7562527.1 PilZ domain-containing protein [Xanthomonadaceae bacterium XH05]
MSIQDPIAIPMTDAAQRRFHRFPVEGSARLYSGSAMWNTQLLDLSLSGVLVERPENWNGAVANRYRLDLRLEGGILISMGVELARIVEGVGLGFTCIKIDLGSFAQLKRLIELNLGNHRTLQHELSVLRD